MSYNRTEHLVWFIHSLILPILLLLFLLTPFITNAQNTNQNHSEVGKSFIRLVL